MHRRRIQKQEMAKSSVPDSYRSFTLAGMKIFARFLSKKHLKVHLLLTKEKLRQEFMTAGINTDEFSQQQMAFWNDYAKKHSDLDGVNIDDVPAEMWNASRVVRQETLVTDINELARTYNQAAEIAEKSAKIRENLEAIGEIGEVNPEEIEIFGKALEEYDTLQGNLRKVLDELNARKLMADKRDDMITRVEKKKRAEELRAELRELDPNGLADAMAKVLKTRLDSAVDVDIDRACSAGVDGHVVEDNTRDKSLEMIKTMCNGANIAMTATEMCKEENFQKIIDAARDNCGANADAYNRHLYAYKKVLLQRRADWFDVKMLDTQMMDKAEREIATMVKREWKTLDEVIARREQLAQNKDVCEASYRKYLIACLYTMQPPLRLKEYYTMRVVDNPDAAGNLCLMRERMFVLRDYKNSDKLHEQRIPICDELWNVISDWLRVRSAGEYLLGAPMEESAQSDDFAEVMGIHVDTLRAIYATDSCAKIQDRRELELVARRMLHSFATHVAYYDKSRDLRKK